MVPALVEALPRHGPQWPLSGGAITCRRRQRWWPAGPGIAHQEGLRKLGGALCALGE
jgi:hypothetical protein